MRKRKKLTPEDVRKWLDETEGVECPMCGSSDVDFDMPDWESGSMYQRGTCKKCGAAWCEAYTLDRVALEGADGQYGEFIEAAEDPNKE